MENNIFYTSQMTFSVSKDEYNTIKSIIESIEDLDIEDDYLHIDVKSEIEFMSIGLSDLDDNSVRELLIKKFNSILGNIPSGIDYIVVKIGDDNNSSIESRVYINISVLDTLDDLIDTLGIRDYYPLFKYTKNIKRNDDTLLTIPLKEDEFKRKILELVCSVLNTPLLKNIDYISFRKVK